MDYILFICFSKSGCNKFVCSKSGCNKAYCKKLVVIQTIIVNLVEEFFVLIYISLFYNIMMMVLNKSILLLSNI